MTPGVKEQRTRRHWCAVQVLVGTLVLGAAGASATSAMADTYTDDFSNGIRTTYWTLSSNQPLYSVDDTNGDVRISRPGGGTSGFQFANLKFAFDVRGDFDVRVDFRDASINRVNGVPGNQIQLNVRLGNQLFAVVRSDESVGGNNYHVFIDPPNVWQGTQSTSATAGTLRVVRAGTTVTGYFNTTPVFTGTFNADDVTDLWLSLHNNGTTDATAVTFDNFKLTADDILFPSPIPVLSSRGALALTALLLVCAVVVLVTTRRAKCSL